MAGWAGHPTSCARMPRLTCHEFSDRPAAGIDTKPVCRSQCHAMPACPPSAPKQTASATSRPARECVPPRTARRPHVPQLKGVVIDDTALFNNKLAEWEAHYSCQPSMPSLKGRRPCLQAGGRLGDRAQCQGSLEAARATPGGAVTVPRPS